MAYPEVLKTYEQTVSTLRNTYLTTAPKNPPPTFRVNLEAACHRQAFDKAAELVARTHRTKDLEKIQAVLRRSGVLAQYLEFNAQAQQSLSYAAQAAEEFNAQHLHKDGK